MPMKRTGTVARCVVVVGMVGTSVAMAAPIEAQQELPAPAVTEVWAPVPAMVDPGAGHGPPSDAIVLFDGTDLSEWRGRDGAPQWDLSDGVVTVRPGTGDLTTKRAFGNVQLHLEWRTPTTIVGESQGRGNSGVRELP